MENALMADTVATAADGGIGWDDEDKAGSPSSPPTTTSWSSGAMKLRAGAARVDAT